MGSLTERNRVILFIGLGIGLLLVVGTGVTVGLYLHFRGSKGKTHKGEENRKNDQPPEEISSSDFEATLDRSSPDYERQCWFRRLARNLRVADVRQLLEQAVTQVDASVVKDVAHLDCEGKFASLHEYSQKRTELIWQAQQAMMQGSEADHVKVCEELQALREQCESSHFPTSFTVEALKPIVDSQVLQGRTENHWYVYLYEFFRLITASSDMVAYERHFKPLTRAVSRMESVLILSKFNNDVDAIISDPDCRLTWFQGPTFYISRGARLQAIASVLLKERTVAEAFADYHQCVVAKYGLEGNDVEFKTEAELQVYMDDRFPMNVLGADIPDHSALLSISPPRGLIRRGCNCYALATMQCLATFQPLIDHHLRAAAERDLSADHPVFPYLAAWRDLQLNNEPALDLTAVLGAKDWGSPSKFVNTILQTTFDAETTPAVRQQLRALMGVTNVHWMRFPFLKDIQSNHYDHSRYMSVQNFLSSEGYPDGVLQLTVPWGPLLLVSNPAGQETNPYDVSTVLETSPKCPGSLFHGNHQMRCELQAFVYSSAIHAISYVKRGPTWYYVNDDQVIAKSPPLTAAEQQRDGMVPLVTFYLCRILP